MKYTPFERLEARTLLAAAEIDALTIEPVKERGSAAATRARPRDPVPGRGAGRNPKIAKESPQPIVTAAAATSLLEDSFTESVNRLITTHQPESGGSYVIHPTTTGNALVMGGTGRARHTSTGNTFITNTAAFTSADYDVEGEIEVLGTLGTTFGSGENGWGILARWDPSSATGYAFNYSSASSTWELFRYASGSRTTLGVAFSDPLTAGNIRTARMELRGDTIRCFVNGALVNTAVDAAPIMAAGRAGLRMYDGQNVPASDTRGIHTRHLAAWQDGPDGEFGTGAWVHSGAVTTNSARVKARVAGDADLRLKYGTTPDLATGSFSAVVRPILAGAAWIGDFALTGLTPGTTYYYAVESNGMVDLTQSGKFQTFAEGAHSFDFVFGADFDIGSTHPVWDTMRSHDPLFTALIGDQGYIDEGNNVPSSFRNAREANHASRQISNYYSSNAVMETWDDHDFGVNNSDSHSLSKPAAHQVYREYVPSYPLEGGSGPTDGIYQSWQVGRVRFIMTDTRTYKTGAGTNTGTILGTQQKQWFKDQLIEAKYDPDVAVIMWFSSVAWNSQTSSDSWAAHQNERRELATFMDENDIPPKLFILAGDSHCIAIDDGSNTNWSADGTGPATPTMIGAAIDRGGSSNDGVYSHGMFPGSGQYGYVNIEDTGGDTITVTMSGITYDNTVLTSLTTVVPVTTDVENPEEPPFAVQSGSTLFVNFDGTPRRIELATDGPTTTAKRVETVLSFTGISNVVVNGSPSADNLVLRGLESPMQFIGGGGSDVIDVASGALIADGNLGDAARNGPAVILHSGATAQFNQSQHLASLDIAGSARATLAADGDRYLFTRSLTVSDTGVLDMADNDLFIDYDDLNPYTTIREYVLSGRQTGTNRVTYAPADGNVVLAIIDNAQYGRSNWNGVSVDPTTIVGKYTYYGDANLDGKVTGDDYVAVDSNLGRNPGTSQWYHGDFNFDGYVTGDDYVAIDSNLGAGTLIALIEESLESI